MQIDRRPGAAVTERLSDRWIRPTRRLAAVAGVGLLLLLGVVQEGPVSDRVANSALVLLLMTTALACVEVIAARRESRIVPRVNSVTPRNAGTWIATTFIVIVGGGLAAQSWFGAGSSIAQGDIGPPDGLAWLGRLFAPWSWSGSDLGSPGALELQLPWAAIVWVIHAVGGQPDLAQRIWYTTAFTGAAASALVLLKTLGASPIPAAIGAAVTIFNPYVLTLNLNPIYLVAIALLALIPTCILAAARSQISVRLAAALIGLCAPLLGYTYENPPLAGMVLVVAMGSPLVGWWLWGSLPARRAALAMLLGIGLLLVASAYWIVPVAIQLHSTAVLSGLAATSSWTWEESRATITNAFWLNTNWTWTPSYLPFAPDYSIFPLSVLKFVLPATAFLGLYVSEFRRKHELRSAGMGLPIAAAASFLALSIIVLSTGTRPPGNLIFDRLYGLPYGWLIREPGRFLILAALAYGVLVAAFAEGLVSTRCKVDRPVILRRLPIGSAAAILLGGAISIGLSFPLANGTVVQDARPPLPSMHVHLPAYWSDMATYIDHAPYDGGVLVLPPDDFYQMPYRWGYYGSDSFISNLMNRSVLAPNPQGYFQTNPALIKTVGLFTSSLLDGDSAEANRLLQALGIQLVLVRGDIDANFPGRSIVDPAVLTAELDRASNFRLIRTDGPLALFAAVNPPPPRMAVTHLFATEDSTSPDLRSLSVLPPDTAIVSAPAIPGVIHLNQVPPLSSWDVGAKDVRLNLIEPVGWQYRLGVFTPEHPSRLVDPIATPSAISPFVAAAVLGQAGKEGTLAIELPLGRSLITDGAFQNGAWQGTVGDCNASGAAAAGPLDATVISDGPNGLPALRLSAGAHSACEALGIAWGGGSVLMDLRIRHVSGSAPRVCVFEIGPQRCAPTSTEIRGTGWLEYTLSVTPDIGTTSLALFIYADGDPFAARTVNDYADVAVYSVPSTAFVLVGFPNDPSTGAAPQLLELSESYSASWTGPPQSRHVLIDGMINGWLLAQTRSDLSATYTPATLVSLGFWVSGGGSGVIIVAALTLLLRKQNWLRVRRGLRG